MALTLADLINEMNAALPSIPRHPMKGIVPQSSRYDGGRAHLVVDTDCRELDHEACPQTIHATLPEEDQA